MKRISVFLASVSLLLACAVPAGAYHWSGESFIDDYYGTSTFSIYELEGGHFADPVINEVSSSFSGPFTGDFVNSGGSFSPFFVDFPNMVACYKSSIHSSLFTPSDAILGDISFSSSFPAVDYIFEFDSPVSSFSFSGSFYAYWSVYFRLFYKGHVYSRFVSAIPKLDVLVGDTVIYSFDDFSTDRDMSLVSYSSSSPIRSFTLRFYACSCDDTFLDYALLGFSPCLLLGCPIGKLVSISMTPYTGPVDPDPPGPVVPGEGDFEYTEISGAELAKDMVLGPNVATGGANVYWTYDSYETGVPPYEVMVPGGSAHQMAPARFPSISLSKSEATVTASIPSTSYTFSWEGGCRVERFESLLTGPPGFSGPGSSALDYVELQIPISSEEPVHNFDLTGAVPVETVYRAGSRLVTRTGGAWSLYVNGALVTSGTTDTYGNIQFNGFVYHSSEPITAITLRLVPTAAGLAFPSNTGRITFSWSMSLDFKDLSMVYLEGEDGAIDLDKFYQQVSDSQGSIDSYDKIESQWTDNMTSNWDALKLDEFSFDAGLISGFALLSGIFNDIWRAFGLFNVVWIAPLMLGISMLVIGRISRDGGKGKGSG